MDAVKWMKMCLYFMLMQHFIEAAEKNVLFSTARVGDDAILHCENVIETRNNCDSTVWLFSNSTKSVILVQNDEDNEEEATELGRLNVTANCSLVIKKVKAEDSGWYSCRQIISRKQQGRDYSVYLLVLDITELKTSEKVTLICSVWEYNKDCIHKVEWLYVGNENTTGMEISTGFCSANVTFPASPLHQNSSYEPFICKMTDGHTKEVQLFTFKPQSPDTNVKIKTTSVKTLMGATTKSPGTQLTSKGNDPTTQKDFGYVMRCIIASVGLAALLLCVVTLNIWTKMKGQ